MRGTILIALLVLGSACQAPEPMHQPGDVGATDAGPSANSDRFRSAAERAELICAFRAACDLHVNSPDFCLSSQLDDDLVYPATRSLSEADDIAFAECLADASDCAGYGNCLGAPGCETGCDGNIARQCYTLRDGSTITASIDCAAAGEVCVGLGFCADSSVTCADLSAELECIGDQSFWCAGDYPTNPTVFDCPSVGQICRGGFCVDAPEQPCVVDDPESIESCREGRPVACWQGFEIVGDCKALHPSWTCVEPDARCGPAPGTEECIPDDSTPTCVGNEAVLCVNGSTFRVDCGAAGATCIDDAGFVTCQFPEVGGPDAGGLPDAGPQDAGGDSTTGVRTDFSGAYLLSTVIIAGAPLLVKVDVVVDPADWTADMIFQLLKTDEENGVPRVDPRTPTGNPTTILDVPLSPRGTFDITLTDLEVPAAANPITPTDARVTLSLHGIIAASNAWCGTTDGEVTVPTSLPFSGDFGATPIGAEALVDLVPVLSCSALP